MLRAVLVVMSAAALLASSAAVAQRPPPPDPAVCKAQGGAIRPVCMLQEPMCILPYPDAGKTCTDSSQCKGGCVYIGPPVLEGQQVQGRCKADNQPCGCTEWVVKGVARITCGD